MKVISNQTFGGERPLFQSHHMRFENVVIGEGESGLKFCSDIECDHCRFEGKYPLWHVEGSLIMSCYFAPASSSAIWYSNHMTMINCVIDAPKLFREMRNVQLMRVKINDADETFWNIHTLILQDVKMREGTYPFMGCTNVHVDNLDCESKYVFQYVKDATIRNAKITTKDAFWETENVTIIDSELNGEYLGWHSKNLKLVNCHITGTQPLCYCENLVLENCTMGDDADLAFEDSVVTADIRGHVHSIKNPRSGLIKVGSVGQIIIDEYALEPNDCKIVTQSPET